MSREHSAHELARLKEASDRVATNLIELEIDSSRQLLEVSTLTGRSAGRWSQASAALTDLWRWQGQLKQLLERAEGLRGPWRANELRSLLDGESIELSRSEVPLAERDLLGSSGITVRCTAEELLERMSQAFDEVKAVVAQFGDAWVREIRRDIDATAALRRDFDARIADARQAVRANRAPIDARNQFRALLEAYQVKAQRLGVVEAPELEQVFARAHEALYTAPTDLALVAQLVRRYQELIISAGTVRETLR